MSERDENALLVWRILLVAGSLALIMAGIGWGFSGSGFALSVLLGAVLVCGSFFLLQRNIRQLLNQVATNATKGSGVTGGANQAGFLVKAFGRFLVLALLLFVFATHIEIQPLGLVLGLTTIMFSVILVGLARKRKRLSGISD